jgi:hypothetical protein
MPEAKKPYEKPIGEFDRGRANREMAKPILSQANKETLKTPVRAASSFIEGVRGAGRSIMAEGRNTYRRMTSGRR